LFINYYASKVMVAERQAGSARMDRLLAFFDVWPYGDPKEQGVNEILKHRIGDRVGALKISWRRASLEAGLEAGFIQDVITGRSKDPPEEALASLAAVLKCSPAYLVGQTEEINGEAGSASGELRQTIDIVQRPDAVMALRIVDELLASGHVDAARIAVKRALKAIAVE
jgi:hypothetical protein